MSRLREKMQARKAARKERQSAGIQQQYGQMTDAYSKILSSKSSEELPKPISTNVTSDFSKFLNSPGMQKAREEIEWREGMDTRMEYDLSKRKLEKEEELVKTKRQELANIARKVVDENLTIGDLGASPEQVAWLQDQSGDDYRNACHSYSTACMSQIQMKSSESQEPYSTHWINKEGKWGTKDQYIKSGGEQKIVPGNQWFDQQHKDNPYSSWQLQPRGTIANQPGDLARMGFYDKWGSRKPELGYSGTHHSMISLGESESGGANVVYNTGDSSGGMKYGAKKFTRPQAWSKKENMGVMRYVGNVPRYTEQFQALGGYENAPTTPRMPTKDAVKIKTEDVKPELQTLPKPTEEEMLSALAAGHKNPNRYKRKLKRQANKFTL